MFKNGLIVVFIATFLISCAKYEGPFDWLEGEWISEYDGQYFAEYWKKEGQQYRAIGFEMNKNDTAFSEKLRIFKKKDKWTYAAQIKNQNEGAEIYFPLVLDSSGHFLFSNPEHDFPTQIRYEKISNDSMVVTVQGMVNGQLNGFSLGFRKN